MSFNALYSLVWSVVVIAKDRKAFQLLYSEMIPKLSSFANKYVDDREVSIDIIQDVFMRLWDNRSSIRTDTSLSFFLFVTVKILLLIICGEKVLQKNSIRIIQTLILNLFTNTTYCNKMYSCLPVSSNQKLNSYYCWSVTLFWDMAMFYSLRNSDS